MTSTTSSVWWYKKWASGKTEAWYKYNVSSTTAGAVWASPIRYLDVAVPIPAGLFAKTPPCAHVTSNNAQWWVGAAVINSATSLSVRLLKPTATAYGYSISIYLIGEWK